MMNNTNSQSIPCVPRLHRGLRIPKVEDRVGISKGHIYRLIGQGKFPKLYKLSERVSVWSEAEIDAWLEAKFSEAS
jgi:prophage regulatory protein